MTPKEVEKMCLASQGQTKATMKKSIDAKASHEEAFRVSFFLCHISRQNLNSVSDVVGVTLFLSNYAVFGIFNLDLCKAYEVFHITIICLLQC